MTKDKINYFKAAFFTKINFAVLGILGILGYPLRFRPYYLLFVLAVESGVIFTLSQNKRFRRAIRALRLKNTSPLPDSTDYDRIRTMLDEEHSRTLKRFDEICSQIRQNAEIIDTPRSALLGVSLSKLDNLTATFTQMLLAEQKYRNYLSLVDRDRIVREMRRLDHEIENRNDKVAELKIKNRDILQQRLERIDTAREEIEYVEAELEVIMNTVQLLRDQTVSISDPQGISQQIDSVLENMKDADQLIREMDSFVIRNPGFDREPMSGIDPEFQSDDIPE